MDWKDNWTVEFVDWGHIPTIRCYLKHNNRIAVCWQENDKYYCCIDFKKTKTFNWPSQARAYAIRVLAASKKKNYPKPVF